MIEAEPELVIAKATGQPPPPPPAGTTLITTKSVAVEPPFVQFKVRVVEEPTAGYHGCPGSIGPPLPEVATPESPDGEVIVQEVALEEVQE